MTRIPFLPLFFLIYLCEAKNEWVDPYSMDTRTKAKIKEISDQNYNLKEEYCSNIKTCNSDLYLKRIVRLILNNAYLDKNDGFDFFTGHINLQLTKKDYEFLLDFSQNDNTKEEIFSEVGSIFEGALQKPSLERYKEMIFTLEEQLYFLIFNPATGALVASVIFLYIVYKLLRAKFTWKSIIKYLIFLLYVSDFIITYLEIRKDEEISNMIALKRLGTVPPECNPQKLSWWAYMKTQFESTFFEHPCKAYYETVSHSELRYLVAPTRILTRQFKTIMVEPVGDLGEAFGKFGRHMFTNLPWGLNIAIFPIMLLASICVIFIILLFITRPRFKISLFHFFTLEIGDSSRRIEARPVQLGIERGRRREVGYNAEHRALIEDASNDDCSSHEQEFNGNQEESVQKCIGVNEGVNSNNTDNELDANCAAVDNLGSNSQTEVQS